MYVVPASFMLGYSAAMKTGDNDPNVFLKVALLVLTAAALIPEPYLKIPLYANRSSGTYWTIITDRGLRGGIKLAYAGMGRYVDWHLQTGVELVDFAVAPGNLGTVPFGPMALAAANFHMTPSLNFSVLAKYSWGYATDTSLAHVLSALRYYSGTSFLEVSAGVSVFSKSNGGFIAPVLDLSLGWIY